MKRITLLLAISLVALFSCNKEKELTPVPEKPVEEGTTVFSASVEDPATKTSIAGKKVSWNEGDKISLFGEGTDATGIAASTGSTSNFPVTGTVGEAPYLAVYPAGCGAYASKTLKVTVPDEQTGAFADANIMVAKSNDENLAFKHLCGLLKFTVGADVTSVKIKADDDVVIAGTVPVTFAGSGIPEIGAVESGAKEIAVDINGPGEYYAALLPGVTLGGFYFEITTTGGSKMVFSPKNLAISRKSVMDMGNIDEHVVTDWFVTPAGAGKKNGVSWENAFGLAELQTLYEGQMTAEDIAKYDKGTFHFAGGTYSLGKQIKFDFTKASDVVTIHWKGGYNPDSKGIDTTDRNVATYKTVFDGTSSEDGRAMRLDCRSDISFDGISVKNFTTGLNTIFLNTGNTTDQRIKGTFTNCVFENNGVTKTTRGVYYGGVFYLYMGELNIVSCSFEGNTILQKDGRGGAIAAQDNAVLNITGTAENKTVFHNNTAAGNGTERGGAIMLERINGSVNIAYAEFTGNSADNGGAISQMNTTQNAMTTNITSCVFDANGGYGAALEAYNAGPQQIKLTDCVIKNNTTRSVVTVGGAVVTIDGADTEVTNNSAYVFSGMSFTVKNGTFSGNTSNVFYGDATVVIDGGNFISNSASYGGVIYSSGNVTINGGTFQKNTSSKSGGVIHVKDDTGEITINSGLFGGESDAEANTCSTNGGVVYLEGSSNVTINGGTFKYNKATAYGGAIGVGSTGTVTITGGTFTSNTSTTFGGVVGCGGTGTVTINGGSFTENTATTYGGVLYGANGSNLTIEGTAGNRILMKDNVANIAKFYSAGGAIYIEGNAETPSSLNVSYCDFEGNKALQQEAAGGAAGGAVGFIGTLSSVSFDNCSFTGNQAYRGGALQFDCNVTGGISLSNCVFNGNVAPQPTKANGGYGAAILVSNNFKTTLTLNRCSFTDNHAVAGGAAYANYNNYMTCKTFFNACKFSGNYVDTATDSSNTLYACSGYVGLNNCAFWDNGKSTQTRPKEITMTPNGSSAGYMVISNTTINSQYSNSTCAMSTSTQRLNVVNSICMSTIYTLNSSSATYVSGSGINHVIEFSDQPQTNVSKGTTSGVSAPVSSFYSSGYASKWQSRFTGYKYTYSNSLSDFTGFTPMTTTTEAYIRGLETDNDKAFADWLGTVHGYDQDIDGNKRESPYWPGCHQK